MVFRLINFNKIKHMFIIFCRQHYKSNLQLTSLLIVHFAEILMPLYHVK